MQNRTEEVLSRSSNIYNTDLKLKDYNYAGIIDTEQELEELKKEILSDDSYFPYYDLDNNKIKLLTWNAIKNSKQYDCIQYSKDKLTAFLDEHLNLGMGILMLTWEFDSNSCNSICVFSGDSIVYDNIILNTLCFEEKKHLTNTTYAVKSRSETTPFKKLTVEFGGDAYWLWDSHRGQVTIRHSIYGSYNNLQSSDCSAFAEMTLGDADARATIKERVIGENGYSICAYGYYLTSLAVSAKITQNYNPISYSVEVSGAVKKVVGNGDNSLHSSQFSQ